MVLTFSRAEYVRVVIKGTPVRWSLLCHLKHLVPATMTQHFLQVCVHMYVCVCTIRIGATTYLKVVQANYHHQACTAAVLIHT